MNAAEMRAQLLAEPVAPSTRVEFDGAAFFIRTPVLDDKDRMSRLAGLNRIKKDRSGKPDVDSISASSLIAAATIVLAVDEVGVAIFTQADMELVRNAGVGSKLGRLSNACFNVMQGRPWDHNPEKETEEPGEDFGGTPSGDSTTSSP